MYLLCGHRELNPVNLGENQLPQKKNRKQTHKQTMRRENHAKLVSFTVTLYEMLRNIQPRSAHCYPKIS